MRFAGLALLGLAGTALALPAMPTPLAISPASGGVDRAGTEALAAATEKFRNDTANGAPDSVLKDDMVNLRNAENYGQQPALTLTGSATFGVLPTGMPTYRHHLEHRPGHRPSGTPQGPPPPQVTPGTSSQVLPVFPTGQELPVSTTEREGPFPTPFMEPHEINGHGLGHGPAVNVIPASVAQAESETPTTTAVPAATTTDNKHIIQRRVNTV